MECQREVIEVCLTKKWKLKGLDDELKMKRLRVLQVDIEYMIMSSHSCLPLEKEKELLKWGMRYGTMRSEMLGIQEKSGNWKSDF